MAHGATLVCRALAALQSTEARAGTGFDGAQVEALVSLKPGTVWQGAFTDFDLEAELQWRYWQKPHSAYTVVVDQLFSLLEPVTVRMRAASATAYSQPSPVTLPHRIFWPAVSPLLPRTLFRGKGGREMALADLAVEVEGFSSLSCDPTVPVLFIPEAIFRLLERGKWNCLLLHLASPGHGNLPAVMRSCLEWLQKNMSWPTAHDFDVLWRNRANFDLPSDHVLTWESAKFLAQQVRKHANVLILEVSRDWPQGDECFLLEQALRGLEAFAEGLLSKSSGASHVQHKKAPALRIIEDIRAVRYLRNKGDLKQIKDSIIRGLMPTQLQSLAKAMMYDPLSSSTISKYQAVSF